MSISLSQLSLRNALLADAASCVSMGLIIALGNRMIAALTAIPTSLLFYAGLLLLPIGLFMAMVAARPNAPSALTWPIIIGNLLWAVLSFGLILSGLIQPNALGVALIVAQALVVLALTALEYGALQRATADDRERQPSLG